MKLLEMVVLHLLLLEVHKGLLHIHVTKDIHPYKYTKHVKPLYDVEQKVSALEF